jgi:hypothetical protein
MTVLETELKELFIIYKYQTLKRFLDKQPPAYSIGESQAQVDGCVSYYNEERPHRTRERQTPR